MPKPTNYPVVINFRDEDKLYGESERRRDKNPIDMEFAAADRVAKEIMEHLEEGATLFEASEAKMHPSSSADSTEFRIRVIKKAIELVNTARENVKASFVDTSGMKVTCVFN